MKSMVQSDKVMKTLLQTHGFTSLGIANFLTMYILCSSNAGHMILFKIAFPTAEKGILDCQKACVGNQECSIYVLHRHFGKTECLFSAI